MIGEKVSFEAIPENSKHCNLELRWHRAADCPACSIYQTAATLNTQKYNFPLNWYVNKLALFSSWPTSGSSKTPKRSSGCRALRGVPECSTIVTWLDWRATISAASVRAAVGSHSSHLVVVVHCIRSSSASDSVLTIARSRVQRCFRLSTKRKRNIQFNAWCWRDDRIGHPFYLKCLVRLTLMERIRRFSIDIRS